MKTTSRLKIVISYNTKQLDFLANEYFTLEKKIRVFISKFDTVNLYRSNSCSGRKRKPFCTNLINTCM